MAYCSPVPTRIAGMGSAAHRQSQLRRRLLRRDSSRVRRAALWRANGVAFGIRPVRAARREQQREQRSDVWLGGRRGGCDSRQRDRPPTTTHTDCPSAFCFVDPTPELHVARPKAD
jgi:hypothetical protein